MARIELSPNISLSNARRVLTRRGCNIALARRYGHVYTRRKTHPRQPNTAAQLQARSLLKQANILARKELQRPGRLDYWTSRSKSLGYKTVLGCVRAHFIAILKARSAKPATKPACSSTSLFLHIVSHHAVSKVVKANLPSVRPVRQGLYRLAPTHLSRKNHKLSCQKPSYSTSEEYS